LATRQHRLGEFEQDGAPTGEPLELLCEDHVGTYLLPYACHWRDGAWHNSKTGAAIEAKVVGWRFAN
jgi:hypothetical protein